MVPNLLNASCCLINPYLFVLQMEQIDASINLFCFILLTLVLVAYCLATCTLKPKVIDSNLAAT